MTEDRRLAREAMLNDAKRMTRDLRRNGIPVDGFTFDEANEAPIDAETMIAFTVGVRGDLTKHTARHAAKHGGQSVLSHRRRRSSPVFSAMMTIRATRRCLLITAAEWAHAPEPLRRSSHATRPHPANPSHRWAHQD